MEKKKRGIEKIYGRDIKKNKNIQKRIYII